MTVALRNTLGVTVATLILGTRDGIEKDAILRT